MLSPTNAFWTIKTQHCDIRGDTHQWICTLFHSAMVHVLWLFLFLPLNDLTEYVSLQVHDCSQMIPCPAVQTHNISIGSNTIAGDLNCKALIITAWVDTHGVKFNPYKCSIVTICQNKKIYTFLFQFCGWSLSKVHYCSYLQWNTHVHNIHTSANKTLGFLKRNLKRCPTEIIKESLCNT